MTKTLTGLMQLQESPGIIPKKGNIAYLCHNASIGENYVAGPSLIKKIFKKRPVALFGPQHGIVGDVQDNMVESPHFIHPYFKIPVHSLYSETRVPTKQMLDNIDILIVDLQDVGCRVYTYISTLDLLMKECGKQDIQVIVLDRPNPIGGVEIEGNILEKEFSSFVGRYPIPMRHGMTMGEMAIFAQKFNGSDCSIKVIPMKNWKRSFYFDQTGLPWIPPSPNLPVFAGSCTFPGTVLLEGTHLSEGRGTTRSLEIIGHPKIEPFQFLEEIAPVLKKEGLAGFILRPVSFLPMFQKHQGIVCGGFHIHMTDRNKFKPWRLVLFLLREFSKKLGSKFSWHQGPYEYEYDKLPIDLINGSDMPRQWVDNRGGMEELDQLEKKDMDKFLSKRDDCLLYR